MKFDDTNKWYMLNPDSVLEKETHKIFWGFELKMDHPISARRPDLFIVNKKQRTYQMWTLPSGHTTQWNWERESGKRDKYLDLAGEMKKLWNMKVTIKPIVIGGLGTVIRLIKGLEDMKKEGPLENIQTTALWRSARILRRILETWSDLMSVKLLWKTISKHWCEKKALKWVKWKKIFHHSDTRFFFFIRNRNFP